MDITSNNNNNNTAAATAISTVKTTEAETETQSHTPIRIQPVKPISFSNGVLKRHNSVNNHHPVVVLYKECLKNHAASLGGHAVDGCGEFMPSPSANPTDPTSLKCAACGCHRNFHRREPEDQPPFHSSTPALEYQPHHRHHPPPPPPPPLQHGGDHSSPNNSPSPPPISSAYYPASAPHMLLALSTGLSGQPDSNNPLISPTPNPISAPNLSNPNGRKRFRTKFTQNQKERMLEFAERVGWKMQKRDEDVINEFCNNIGVEKGVLKVWMHNNKNTFGRKSDQPPSAAVNTTTAATTITHLNGNANGFGLFSRNNNTDNNTTAATEFHLHHHHESSNDNDKDHSVSAHNVVTTNGSSTSS